VNHRLLASCLAAALLVVPLAGCSSDGGGDGGDEKTLTVYAAASLTGAFTELGTQFEEGHPGVQVVFNFAGSSDLVAQIQQGAPADVFASADEANMDKAAGDDLVDGDPVPFATNTLEIAVPPDNPAGVQSLDDLASGAAKVVLCAPEVPCGAAAVEVEKNAGIDIAPVSEEQSVTDVLGKVTSGEADAGLVYVTDVQAAGADVTGIEVPADVNVLNTYLVATLGGSDQPDLADEFAQLVAGPDGQAVLADFGFGPPAG
jgi:molybdate transport system substrate-binding protein